jgi:hypothetical protein
MSRHAIDLSGKVFSKLTVVRRSDLVLKSSRHATWECVCECGNRSVVPSSRLIKGDTTSCGCYGRTRIGDMNKTHGMTSTSMFAIWSGMLGRCSNHKSKDFPRYGGRGIQVCERWKSFDNFYADMGDRPKGKTLDRINNSGNYEPGNCRWASASEQATNRRSTHYVSLNGETLPLSEWAAKLDINPKTISTRLHRGWSYEEALRPTRKYG